MSISAVPVLPATEMPSSAAAVPVPSRTTLAIMSPTSRAVDAFITCDSSLGLDASDRAPVAVDDRGRRGRLHQRAAVGHGRGDHRHLQRRREQAVLADRHAPDVDASGSSAATNAPARRENTPLGARSLGGQVDRRRARRSRSAPCTRCIVSPPSFSPTSAHTVLTEFVSASVSGIVPKLLVAEVVQRRAGDRLWRLAARRASPACSLPAVDRGDAVTTLNVEPGGYWPSVVRLSAEPSVERVQRPRVAQRVRVERRRRTP